MHLFPDTTEEEKEASAKDDVSKLYVHAGGLSVNDVTFLRGILHVVKHDAGEGEERGLRFLVRKT